MSDYDLSTDGGRWSAMLSERRLRYTLPNGHRWERELRSDGSVYGRASVEGGFTAWCGHVGMGMPQGGVWSIVEPGPKPVEEMATTGLEDELGRGRQEHYTPFLCRIVAEQRARSLALERYSDEARTGFDDVVEALNHAADKLRYERSWKAEQDARGPTPVKEMSPNDCFNELLETPHPACHGFERPLRQLVREKRARDEKLLLQALSQPLWTKNKPTDPGAYWAWQDGVNHPSLVQFRDASTVYLFGVSGVDKVDAYDWWLGPLDLPDRPVSMSPAARRDHAMRPIHEMSWDDCAEELVGERELPHVVIIQRLVHAERLHASRRKHALSNVEDLTGQSYEDVCEALEVLASQASDAQDESTLDGLSAEQLRCRFWPECSIESSSGYTRLMGPCGTQEAWVRGDQEDLRVILKALAKRKSAPSQEGP